MTSKVVTLGDHRSGSLRLPIGIALPDGSLFTHATLRDMGGDEEDILVDDSKSKTAVLEVLRNVITNFGDVQLPESRVRQIVDYLPQQDATYLVVRLRQQSLGDKLVFSAKCPIKRCQNIDKTASVLLSERGCTYRPDSVTLTSTLRGTLEDKTEFEFRLLTLRDQSRLSEINESRRDARATMILHTQIVTFDGSPVPDPDVLAKWPSRLRAEMRGVMEQYHYGIDTAVEHECSKCQNIFEMTLPIMSEARFFFPSGTKRL